MIEKLKELLKKSYSPYSNFPVAAIAIMKDGREFEGVNVEDASTRAGTCAERAAMFSAITAGYTKGDFKEIHVMVSSGKIGMPCFVCRQMLVELFDLELIMVFVQEQVVGMVSTVRDDSCALIRMIPPASRRRLIEAYACICLHMLNSALIIRRYIYIILLLLGAD